MGATRHSNSIPDSWIAIKYSVIINTSPENQLEMKKVRTCSPLHAQNYVNQSLEDPGSGGYAVWSFYLGGLAITGAASNATYSYNTHAKQDHIKSQLYFVTLEWQCMATRSSLESAKQ